VARRSSSRCGGRASSALHAPRACYLVSTVFVVAVQESLVGPSRKLPRLTCGSAYRGYSGRGGGGFQNARFRLGAWCGPILRCLPAPLPRCSGWTNHVPNSLMCDVRVAEPQQGSPSAR
jgi:hypothetical protein